MPETPRRNHQIRNQKTKRTSLPTMPPPTQQHETKAPQLQSLLQPPGTRNNRQQTRESFENLSIPQQETAIQTATGIDRQKGLAAIQRKN